VSAFSERAAPLPRLPAVSVIVTAIGGVFLPDPHADFPRAPLSVREYRQLTTLTSDRALEVRIRGALRDLRQRE